MAKEKSAFQRKIDNICRVIFLTEDGKPKSPVLIYSFSLALVFMVVLLVSYWVLTDPLEKAFSGSSVTVRNIFEYTVPAIAGCIPCVALSFAFRERKNMVSAAFTWVCIITLVMMVTMAFMVDREDRKTEYSLFMAVAGLPMLLSAVTGKVSSQIVFRCRVRAQEERMEKYSSRR